MQDLWPINCFCEPSLTTTYSSQFKETMTTKRHAASLAKNNLIATHECADCDPSAVVATTLDTWEPCIILRTTKRGHDVQFVFDSKKFFGVPKRFVRSLKLSKSPSKSTKRKRCESRGWNNDQLAAFEEAKAARVQAILDGNKKAASHPNKFMQTHLTELGVRKRYVNYLVY